MTRAQAEQLAAWLEDTAETIDYGEIKITVTRHGGQTRQIEKSTATRERQDDLEAVSQPAKGQRRYGT